MTNFLYTQKYSRVANVANLYFQYDLYFLKALLIVSQLLHNVGAAAAWRTGKRIKDTAA